MNNLDTCCIKLTTTKILALSVTFFRLRVSDNNLNGYIEEFSVLDSTATYSQIHVKNNKGESSLRNNRLTRCETKDRN